MQSLKRFATAKRIGTSSAANLTTQQKRFFLMNTMGNTMRTRYFNFLFFLFVRERNAILIHRFSKFHKKVESGFNFIIPFIDQVAYVHDLRETALEIHPQVAVTKDNVALNIDGVLYIQITDPLKASYGVEDIMQAITNLAQTIMRSEIGKITLDRTFEEREYLNEQIIKQIHRETQNWGIEAMRYEIKDIDPPDNISKSMILQAEAERKKRAQILTSEGDKIANINYAEADKIAAVLEAEGKAESMIIQSEASSQALQQIDSALISDSGKLAAQFLLGQRYIDAYQNLAKSENTIIINSEPINVNQQVNTSFNFFGDAKPL